MQLRIVQAFPGAGAKIHYFGAPYLLVPEYRVQNPCTYYFNNGGTNDTTLYIAGIPPTLNITSQSTGVATPLVALNADGVTPGDPVTLTASPVLLMPDGFVVGPGLSSTTTWNGASCIVVNNYYIVAALGNHAVGPLSYNSGGTGSTMVMQGLSWTPSGEVGVTTAINPFNGTWRYASSYTWFNVMPTHVIGY